MIISQPQPRDEKPAAYLILSDLNLEELAASVCLRSDEGWEPAGGPLFARGMFYQAVYRKPERDVAVSKYNDVPKKRWHWTMRACQWWHGLGRKGR